MLNDQQKVNVFIVRHGRTKWNQAQIKQGQLDSELTDIGQIQVRNNSLSNRQY